jgi:hypothetical protein
MVFIAFFQVLTDFPLVFGQRIIPEFYPYHVSVGNDRVLGKVAVAQHLFKLCLVYFRITGAKISAEQLESNQYGKYDGIDPVNAEAGTLAGIFPVVIIGTVGKLGKFGLIIVFIWLL